MKWKPAFEFDSFLCPNTSKFSNDNSDLFMETEIEHPTTSEGGDRIGQKNNLENHLVKNFYDRLINWFLFTSRLIINRHISPVDIKNKLL